MAVSRVTTKNNSDGNYGAHATKTRSWLSVAEEKWEALSSVSPVYNITRASMLTESGPMGNSHVQLALLHGIKDSEQIINTK